MQVLSTIMESNLIVSKAFDAFVHSCRIKAQDIRWVTIRYQKMLTARVFCPNLCSNFVEMDVITQAAIISAR
jgi:hypothetical protein